MPSCVITVPPVPGQTANFQPQSGMTWNTFVPAATRNRRKSFQLIPRKSRIPRRSNSPLTFCDTFSLRTSHYLTETNPPPKADN